MTAPKKDNRNKRLNLYLSSEEEAMVKKNCQAKGFPNNQAYFRYLIHFHDDMMSGIINLGNQAKK